MSEKNKNRKNENNKKIDIKKIILILIISIISIGIIIILYYLFTPEWGDNRARIWNILEKSGQKIGFIEKNKTISNNYYNGLNEEEWVWDDLKFK